MWQPIESAPKDGEPVIVGVIDGFVSVACWHPDEQQWWELNNDPTDHWGDYLIPTHWMPLPAPPSRQEK